MLANIATMLYDGRVRKTIFFLAVFVFIFYGITLQKVYAACVSSNASPSIATTQDSITISFTIPAANTEVPYRLTVTDQNNTIKATREGKTDRHNAGGTVYQGTGQETVGPFSGGGTYRAQVYNKNTLDVECYIPFSITGAPTPTSTLPTSAAAPTSGSTACSVTAPQTVTTGETYTANISFTTSPFTAPVILEYDPTITRSTTIDRKDQQINLQIPTPGKFRIVISSTPPGKRMLCASNEITATAAPTPTPGGPTLTPTPPTACNPPGTDSTTGQCLDINCTRSSSGICVPLSGIFPTSVPLSTPIPPGFPCAQPNTTTGRCDAVGTAIGNIDTDPAKFIKKIFTVLLSMAGGWAVYLIITAGYQLMFSGHDAEKVQEARDKITSAIVGLVFMILSLIILRIIGVDIFQLPTFG